MVTEWAEGADGPRSSNIDWKRELSLGLERFAWISPVSSLQQAHQGDVLLSASGNLRLFLSLQDQGDDARLIFLTRMKSGSLRLESAMRSKIDQNRITAIVSNKRGNPLEYFSEIAVNLSAYKSVLHNVEVFLRSGNLGRSLGSLIESKGSSSKDNLITVHCGVAAASGMIREVGDVAQSGPYTPVGLQIQAARLPAKDYIENILFYGEVDLPMKTSILAAAVIANTLENVQGLVLLKSKVE